MELETRDNENSSQSQDAALSAELSRILDTARQAIEDEFRQRLAAAVSDREQALSEARLQISEELRRQSDETLQQTTLRLEAESAQRMAEFAQRMTETAAEWEAERARLTNELKILRAYTDGQRRMAESQSQIEILGHFLDYAETFAPNLAVYVTRSEGLALWRMRGTAVFPDIMSKASIDPEGYFKPIVVRDRIVAAVCARQPLNSESLDFLSRALSREIEAFGARLQGRAAKPVAS
jgi:hypothetical protein